MSFATKYRPRSLDDMVGQEPAVLQIKGMFERKDIGSSFLITGPTGSGKTTLARIIAASVNGVDQNPDWQRSDLIDTVEINGADARGIDDVRQLIRASKFAPKKNYRVYILDEIHQWTSQAKQAFLKALEEPSPRTLFILCTNESEKLPSTIIGRCQQIRLNNVSAKSCVRLLKSVSEKEGFNLPEETLKQLAHITKGSLRESLQALEAVCNYISGGGDINDAEKIASAVEQVTLIPRGDYLQKYLFSVYQGKYGTAVKVASVVQNVDHFIRGLMDVHEQVMFSVISAKLISAYSQRWAELATESGLTRDDMLVMSDMLDEMVKSAALVGQYTVDANHVLVALTTRLVTMMKRSRV